MPLWSILIVASFVILGTGMAFQLLRRGGETKGRAEWLFAFGILALLVGFGGWVAHVSLQEFLSEEFAFAISLLGEAVSWVGCTALFLGSWRFYRPQSRTCGLLAMLACCVHLSAVVAFAIAGEPVEPSRIALANVAAMLSRAACFAWWGSESIRYFTMMRRRVAIGLADPVVASRFLMLGVSSFCISACMLIVSGASWAFQTMPREMPLVLATLLIIACVGVTCLYCAFFEPGFYRSLVQRRAAASDSQL